jgi:hypothetical protein
MGRALARSGRAWLHEEYQTRRMLTVANGNR